MDEFYSGIFDGLTPILEWEKLADLEANGEGFSYTVTR